MKNYSQFTVEYVNDICNELKSKGFIADRYLEKTFEPENFETLTNFLQGYIVKSFEVYTHLDNLGLVNRGKCPYTGERIDSSFPSWSFMNTRKVYVSHKGYQIMQKEDDEEFAKIMGTPMPKRNISNSNSPKTETGGCYIATACYGNEFAPEVLHLKSYRDNVLSKTMLGRLFIKTYYFLSPPIANKLRGKEKINSFVRNNILNKIFDKIK